MWGVPRDVKGYSYNLDKAKQELALAKAKVDRPLTVGYLQGFSQTEQRPLSWLTAFAIGLTPSSRARCGPRWSSG
jgi:hypothetical protein